MLPISFLVAQVPQETEIKNPKFIISSWSFPDEYGQGIGGIHVYENSTGAWLDHDPSYLSPNEGLAVEIFLNGSLKLQIFSYINKTLVGFSTTNEGKNHIRHNITIMDTNDTVVFSQQNFTYFTIYTGYDPIYLYSYTVILNFVPTSGQIYIATITYEIFW
jgi:hypothetical protein